MHDLININDFEKRAKEKLASNIFDYFAGGAGDEFTLKNNHQAFNQIQFRYRVLSGSNHTSLTTKVLNQTLSMPIIVAPMGFQSMAHPDGEIATIKAAEQQGTFVITSTMSNSSLEEASNASKTPLWFQLYIYKDRTITESLVNRAENANFKALVLTVDAPIPGLRERDVRNHFTLPKDLTIKNLEPFGLQHFGNSKNSMMEYTNRLFDPSLSWKDIQWLRSITKLPLLLKGIVHPDDAIKALESGIDGIIVSNHGGRQLDTSIATIQALPSIAKVINKSIPILIDGGFYRGTDVIKALALGADAILIGRPMIWGLAVNGQKGSEKILEILHNELRVAMTLFGFSSVEELKEEGKNYLEI